MMRIKAALCLLICFSLVFGTVAQAAQFINGEWVNVAQYEERKYYSIDRGEACTYLMRLYKYTTSKEITLCDNPFSDIDPNEFPQVIEAYSLGLVYGTDSSLFMPHKRVTRAELGSLIVRLILKMYPDTNCWGWNSIEFPDEVPDWAAFDLKLLFSRGITAGHDDNYETIGAYDFLTLEEAVKMLDKTMRATPSYPIIYDTFNVNKAYITVDDAVSHNTAAMLDTLKKYDAKATFFITGQGGDDIIRRMAAEGHAIGNHTSTHKYSKIYANTDAFWADFSTEERYLQSLIGYKPTLVRFPGGSNNTTGSKGVMSKLTSQMRQKGYTYFDWNVSGEDAIGASTASVSSITSNVLNGCKGKRSAVILLHGDGTKKTTAQALDGIMKTLKERGYVFVKLTDKSFRPQFLK